MDQRFVFQICAVAHVEPQEFASYGGRKLFEPVGFHFAAADKRSFFCDLQWCSNQKAPEAVRRHE